MEEFLNETNDCPKTRNITSVNLFQRLLAVELVLALFALVPNAVMVIVVARARVFHTNLRLLLAHLNLILCWYSAALLVKSLTLFINLHSGRVCSLSMNLFDCKLNQFPVAFPNNALTYASFAICLERVYCTIRYKHYDKNGAKPWLALVLITVLWTIVITNQLINLLSTSQLKIIPLCENLLSVTPAASTWTLIPQLSLEGSIVLCSLAVYLYNKKQLSSSFVNHSKMTLSARFQLDQNVQLNRIVTPSMIFEAICYIPVMLILMLLNQGYDVEIATKVLLIHFSYIWKLAFCCLQPLLAFKENPHLRKGVRKLVLQMKLTILAANNRVSPTQLARPRLTRTAAAALKDAEAYFASLEQQWETKRKSDRRQKACLKILFRSRDPK